MKKTQKIGNGEKMSEEKATVAWVKVNIKDVEVCDFFVATLQAKVMK